MGEIERQRGPAALSAQSERAAECNCDSMGGRFGAHRAQCPWQVAFDAQAQSERMKEEQ